MNLRKVTFKKWIPSVYESINGRQRIKHGTACYENHLTEGLFHQWANACKDSNEGFGNYTVALVELSDGTIEEVLPQDLKFVA